MLHCSSRLAPVYNEVAPVFAIFGQLFGKALEVQVWNFVTTYGVGVCVVRCLCMGGYMASSLSHTPTTCPPLQARIALINTILTAIGMWVLEIPGMAILSLFVFTCRCAEGMGGKGARGGKAC